MTFTVSFAANPCPVTIKGCEIGTLPADVDSVGPADCGPAARAAVLLECHSENAGTSAATTSAASTMKRGQRRYFFMTHNILTANMEPEGMTNKGIWHPVVPDSMSRYTGIIVVCEQAVFVNSSIQVGCDSAVVVEVS